METKFVMNGELFPIESEIKKRRIAAGLLQKELAEKVGVSVSTIRMDEKKGYRIKISCMVKYANYFGVSIHQMFGYSQELNGSSVRHSREV